ncbi:MAG: MBL fold metallo-hydrolase [Burkholderiales bacterium]|nr:MBL fold metallo-hydrolase [Burkholderiales bacterium]
MPGGFGFAEALAALERVGATLLVRGWLSANNVVFDEGPDGPACVVDTGYVTHLDQTLALVEHALRGQSLGAIINTHLHSDHCGGNAGLQRRWPGASLSVPRGYREAVAPWDEGLLSYQHTGQQCERFAPSAYFSSGTDLQLGACRWQVHPAPGHDPDAVMLFQPEERILISGDALWENRLAIIFPALAGAPGFDDAHRALATIERLSPLVVLPGHGALFTDVAGAVQQSRARIDAFAAAPERHRKHAARALLMYHMLEVLQSGRAELIEWISRTPVFREALGCDNNDELACSLATETLDRLLADHVLRQQGETIVLT